MQDEVRLQEELAAVNARLRRVNRDMLLLEGVPTAGPFSKPSTNLLVVSTRSSDMPYLVLVDQDLDYRGDDPFLRSLFSGQNRANGWRPLLLAPGHLRQPGPVEVARAALRFVGFPPLAEVAPLPFGLSAEWGYREAFPPVVGRDRLLRAVDSVLDAEGDRRAALLVGPSGVGKTALAREAAWRWRARGADHVACRIEVPAVFDPDALHDVLEEAIALGPKTLVVLDELSAGWLTPKHRVWLRLALARGLRLCATARAPTCRKLRDTLLFKRLRPLRVDEPAPSDLVGAVLPVVARHLEVRYGVTVVQESINLAVRRSEAQRGAQPGKAVRLLEDAVMLARERGLTVLGPDDLFES